MDALDLKFDTDYRVITGGYFFRKGDVVRRSGSSLDDACSIRSKNDSGVLNFLSIGDVEEIVPDDPQINFNTLKTALKSLTTIIPPEVRLRA